MKKRIYIAGPMRGHRDFNFNAFFEAEVDLESEYTVGNPARWNCEKFGWGFFDSEKGELVDLKEEFDLRDSLQDDLLWIIRYADMIYMLKGWEDSKGARAEKAVAEALGLEVMYD